VEREANNQPLQTYLKGDDVGISGFDFLQNRLFPVVPAKCPSRTIAVQIRGGVLVAEDIVAEDREGCCNTGKLITSVYM